MELENVKLLQIGDLIRYTNSIGVVTVIGDDKYNQFHVQLDTNETICTCILR